MSLSEKKQAAMTALLDAITNTATNSEGLGPEGRERLGTAANQFAEAYAWLSVQSQPH